MIRKETQSPSQVKVLITAASQCNGCIYRRRVKDYNTLNVRGEGKQPLGPRGPSTSAEFTRNITKNMERAMMLNSGQSLSSNLVCTQTNRHISKLNLVK